MKVTTIMAAWDEARKIFPTDYAKDEKSSERAGYPIYRSTAEGVNAWISDLGSRLEVNLPDGSTANIWIEKQSETQASAEMQIAELKATVETLKKELSRYKPDYNGGVAITNFRHRTWQKNGLRQEELQRLVRKIFENGTLGKIHHNTYGTNDPATTHGDDWGNVLSGDTVYTVTSKGIPVRYVIHMNGLSDLSTFGRLLEKEQNTPTATDLEKIEYIAKGLVAGSIHLIATPMEPNMVTVEFIDTVRRRMAARLIFERRFGGYYPKFTELFPL